MPFARGGISNPLQVIEQITYLLFIRRLGDLHNLAKRQARYGTGARKPVFTGGWTSQ
jgi:type I restriction enzyme M protein